MKEKTIAQLMAEQQLGETCANALHKKLQVGGQHTQMKIWITQHKKRTVDVWSDGYFHIYLDLPALWHVELRGGSRVWGLSEEVFHEFLWKTLAVLTMKTPFDIPGVVQDGCISFFPTREEAFPPEPTDVAELHRYLQYADSFERRSRHAVTS